MPVPSTTLGHIAAALLAPATTPPSPADRRRISEAIARFHDIVAAVTGIDADPNHPLAGDHDKWLAHGMAVSPKLAAKCLIEIYRTWCFLNGTYAAIREAQKRFPGQTIHALYAGCGPYATLLLPLTACFPPDQLQITLIESQQPSFEAVQQVIDAFDRRPYIAACHLADAATYRHPAGSPLHVVVAETMQGALDREPQVALALNLAPQLAPGGLLIPKRITVSACLAVAEQEDAANLSSYHPDGFPVDYGSLIADRVPLGTLLTLDKRTAVQWAPRLHQEEAALPPVTLVVPERPPGYNQLLLTTDVTIFGGFFLANYDSEVCRPVVLYDLEAVAPGTAVTFTYQLGRRPRFHYQTGGVAVQPRKNMLLGH